MKDLIEYLANHAMYFDKKYKNYADARYGDILKMVETYDRIDLDKIKNSQEIDVISSILRPLIAIKNYKSQTPFPEDFLPVIERIVSIRKVKPEHCDILKNDEKTDFQVLLSLQGFDLPTVSAIYHFCWPKYFPIVDRNVQAACAHLQEYYPNTFGDIQAPSLPYPTTSFKTKAKRYIEFITYIEKIKNYSSSKGKTIDFRFIDKALMVLGGSIRKSKSP